MDIYEAKQKQLKHAAENARLSVLKHATTGEDYFLDLVREARAENAHRAINEILDQDRISGLTEPDDMKEALLKYADELALMIKLYNDDLYGECLDVFHGRDHLAFLKNVLRAVVMANDSNDLHNRLESLL